MDDHEKVYAKLQLPIIMALTGRAGHGKDTVADYLVEKHNFKKMSFAAPLKEAASSLFCIPMETMEDRVKKEQIDKRWGKSPRTLLQLMGTEFLRKEMGEDFLVARMKTELFKRIQNSERIVISDCRFDNEADFIKNACKFVRHLDQFGNITRSFQPITINVWEIDASARLCDSILNAANATHASEKGIKRRYITKTIENNQSVEDLYNHIDSLLA